MVGRKTDCTLEITKAVSDNISLGLSNRDAAIITGVGERNFYNWYNRGEEESKRLAEDSRRKLRKAEEPFFQFFQSVKLAKSKRKQLLIGRIQKAANGGELFTETRQKFRRLAVSEDEKTGDVTYQVVLIEESRVEKTKHSDWTAAAWLLERLHPEEFGRRSKIELYDWRKEVKELLDSGAIALEDIPEAFGEDLAREFFESAGLDYVGVGSAEIESQTE